MRLGTKAEVRLWSAPDRSFPALVREVAPAADAVTRTYSVKVRVDAPEASLPLGATATVVMAAIAKNGLRLPLRAVGQREGHAVVWLFDAEKGSVEPMPVTLLRFEEQWAFVSADKLAGRQVVSTGIHLLQPGMKVRPVTATESIKLDVSR
jgi:multidrug efflux pump subunit AcrA (membrane-fusion protein)